MKSILSLFFILTLNIASAQIDVNQLKNDVVREGKLLYQSERASWLGTDLFMEKTTDKSNIGGYFSYTENNRPTCIFFSKDENPKAIGKIKFDIDFNLQKADINLSTQNLSELEKDYVAIIKAAKQRIQTDTIFKFYQNTNFNLVPLIDGNNKKLYILTASTLNNELVIGNDYLINFNQKNQVTSTEKLHKSLLKFTYGDGSIGPAHNHLNGFCEIMTPTDICTTMLYQHLTNWETHYVVTKNYVSIWDCKKNELVVMKHEDWKKIQE